MYNYMYMDAFIKYIDVLGYAGIPAYIYHL